MDFLRVYSNDTHLCNEDAVGVLHTAYQFEVDASPLLIECEFPKMVLYRNLNLSWFCNLYCFYKLGQLQLLSGQVDMYAKNTILINIRNYLLTRKIQVAFLHVFLVTQKIRNCFHIKGMLLLYNYQKLNFNIPFLLYGYHINIDFQILR